MSQLSVGQGVHIYAKRLPQNELPQLLAALHNGNRFRYIMVAWWDEIAFEFFGKVPDEHLQASEWGRAFGERAEVYWRRDEEGQGFLVRWIFEGDSPPIISDAKPLDKPKELEAECRAFLLWGPPYWENGQWKQDGQGHRICYTARIPRLLAYPIDDDLANQWQQSGDQTPVVLRVRVYLGEGGQPVFERFVGLARYKSPQSQGGSADE